MNAPMSTSKSFPAVLRPYFVPAAEVATDFGETLESIVARAIADGIDVPVFDGEVHVGKQWADALTARLDYERGQMRAAR